MKRPNQEDSQDATARGKQARTHGQPAGAASGSRTVVQPASVLALQPHTDGDDMNVDSDHELDREDATSMDEDLDQDSDLEGDLTNQVCIVFYTKQDPFSVLPSTSIDSLFSFLTTLIGFVAVSGISLGTCPDKGKRGFFWD